MCRINYPSLSISDKILFYCLKKVYTASTSTFIFKHCSNHCTQIRRMIILATTVLFSPTLYFTCSFYPQLNLATDLLGCSVHTKFVVGNGRWWKEPKAKEKKNTSNSTFPAVKPQRKWTNVKWCLGWVQPPSCFILSIISPWCLEAAS